MAIVQTNFLSQSVLNTAYTNASNGIGLENAISWGVAAYENADSGIFASVSNLTSSFVSGTLTTGDFVSTSGRNLHTYPYTINKLDYEFTGRNIDVTLYGSVSKAAASVNQTGYVNQIIFSSPTEGQVTINGYDNVAIYSDGSVTDATFNRNGTITTLSGDFKADTYLVNNTFQTTVTGPISNISLALNNQFIQFTNLSVDFQSFVAVDNGISINSIMSLLLSGNDQINGSIGNDYLAGFSGNDVYNGGSGSDTVAINANFSSVSEFRNKKSGGILISSPDGQDILNEVERVVFLDGDYAISDILSMRKPKFVFQDANGLRSEISPTVYTGPVSFLEYEFIGGTQGEVFDGSSSNDFINLGEGDDAANGGLGDDVLDGGTGSNFLTGGGGDDTIFLDGRSGSVTWSTVTDFSDDEVNIWGWQADVSKLLLTESNGGATGFTGATFHYDLNNDANIDTSITFSGLSIDSVPNGQALSVAGNGYLLVN